MVTYFRDFYAYLGVSVESDDSEIKKAFRKKALSCHPDTAENKQIAHDQFIELRRIYEILITPDLRKGYDEQYASFKKLADEKPEENLFINDFEQDQSEFFNDIVNPKKSNYEKDWHEFTRLKDEYFTQVDLVTGATLTTIFSLIASAIMSIVISLGISFFVVFLCGLIYTIITGSIASIVGAIFVFASGSLGEMIIDFKNFTDAIGEKHTSINVELLSNVKLSYAQAVNRTLTNILRYGFIPPMALFFLIWVFFSSEHALYIFVGVIMILPISLAVLYFFGYMEIVMTKTNSRLIASRQEQVRIHKYNQISQEPTEF